MKIAVRLQLSVMMFLEFFVWGAWFVTMSTFLLKSLHTTGTQVSYAYLSQSIGAIIAPFIVGLIADRFAPAQLILGVLHLIGAMLLWLAGNSADYETFFPLILLYMVLFMPTLALVNTVCFRQMQNPSKEFPVIRTLGTLGWIIASVVISRLAWDKEGNEGLLANTFKMAAVASGLLGLLSFTLPNTPPLKKDQKISVGEILGFDALRLLTRKSYLFFFLASIAICIPLAFYYNFTNAFLLEIKLPGYTEKQSYGQISELLFMLLMPLFFSRLGVKKMLVLGMGAWAIRYLLFAFGNVDANYWMLITGIILHGICYDFFFVTGQIYTDSLAGEKFKSAAQGLITLATYGIGMMMGYLIAGPIVDAWKLGENNHDWKSIWLVPAAIALVVLLLFILLFREGKAEKEVTMQKTA